MPRTQRQREILAAALTCFNEHGIEGTTIDMIRQRSGASVGSLYHHFGNKERIAASLFVEGMNDHYQRLSAALETASSAEQGIHAIVRNNVEWVANNPEWARFVLSTRSQIMQSDAGELITQNNREHFEYLRERMQRWVNSGAIRQLPSACYHSIIVGPSHDYARGWLSGRYKTDIREHAEIFADAAWRALKAD